MNIPLHSKVLETELSKSWFDEEGIFCTVYTKSSEISIEVLEQTFSFINAQAGDQKICWLADTTLVKPSKEARNFAMDNASKRVKAMGLITNSPASKIAANIYISLRKPPYPTKLFTEEPAARQWLRQYL